MWPAERLAPLALEVPGDFSSAAPLVVAATLLSGSELRIHGVNLNPTRTGLLDVLDRMGARVAVFNRRSLAGEPAGDLEVRAADLTATTVTAEEVPSMIDELPLFALAAGMAHGESRRRGRTGVARKRVKSHRDRDNCPERPWHPRLRAHDGFGVRGIPTRPKGGGMSSDGDHRLAMLGAVAGLVSREGVRLEEPEAVAISFPGFYDLLESVTRR